MANLTGLGGIHAALTGDFALPPAVYNNQRILAAATPETMSIPTEAQADRGCVVIVCDAFVVVRFDGVNPPNFADIDTGLAGQGCAPGVRNCFMIPAGAVDIRFNAAGAVNVTASFYTKS